MQDAINLKVDAKGRISIGSFLKKYNISSVQAHFDKKTKNIILEPLVEIPLSEWIFEEQNKDKLKIVEKGLKEAKKGETEYLGDFSKYIK